MHPPDGPPVCTALMSLPSGAPPPISSTMVRNVIPIGTSTRPVLRTLPARENTLVPRLLPTPMLAYQSGPRRSIGVTLENVSTLLIRVAVPQARFAGIRRPRPRRAAPPFNRRHQRGFFAADKSAGADPQIDPKI